LSEGWNAIKEFPLPTASSNPSAITLGPDGALWFMESPNSAQARIGRIDTKGALTEYTLSSGACCGAQFGITAGSDGALWFAVTFSQSIGRITTTGVITQYFPATCCINPTSITAGPDGALWFTDENGKIGRITTSGVITEFPTLLTQPSAITTGPDGAVWFIESSCCSNGRVGRITTAGIVTEYPLPTATNLGGITSGPDGALWFTETIAGKIGRITTGGVLTEFALAPNSNPTGITVGPDHALWLTEPNANKIARITTTGFVTEYVVPSAVSGPVGITKGPDGGLWFTESTGNNIGRAWACGLGLNLSFANTTLDIGFDLGTATPAKFGSWLITSKGFQQLWLLSIGAMAPPVPFAVPWGPGFPPLGSVAVLSTLSTSTAGLVCYETQSANSGGTGATVAQLQKLISASGILPGLP
jgi:virginiamycin B lyase